MCNCKKKQKPSKKQTKQEEQELLLAMLQKRIEEIENKTQSTMKDILSFTD